MTKPSASPPTISSPASASTSPFAQPIFRAVWIASLFSNFGSLVQSVAAAWLMTTLATSAHEVALVQASVALPVVLFSLLAGAVADNLDRRLMMLGAQGFMLSVSVVLTLCAWLQVLTPYTLLLFTFLIGCGAAFNNPAWQASVGDMVPRAALPNAVAYNSMGFNIARSVGPAIGGAIIAAAGVAAAFVLNAVSYLGLITVLMRWQPVREPRELPRERLGLAMQAGLRYVALSPGIRRVMLRAGWFGLAASAVPALMPLVARDLITGGALVYGTLFAAFGMGAVAGALLSGRFRRRLSTEQVVASGALALTTGAAVTAVSAHLPATVPALMLAGAGWVLALSTFNVAVQLASPRWVVARTLSLYQMAVFGGMTIGSFSVGLLAEQHGVRVALLVAAAVQVSSVVIGRVLPVAQTEPLDLDPLGPTEEPDTHVAVQPRSGPIVVAVEYRVSQSNVTAFLHAMSEQRRICRRDGARRWTLLRDLADGELWIERYHLPTWLDYMRSDQRRTHSDAEHLQRVGSLLREGTRPRVRRLIERQTTTHPTDQPPTPRELAAALTDPGGRSD